MNWMKYTNCHLKTMHIHITKTWEKLRQWKQLNFQYAPIEDVMVNATSVLLLFIREEEFVRVLKSQLLVKQNHF
jgi:hypothetical protein